MRRLELTCLTGTWCTALKERTTRIKGDGSQMQRMQCARFVLKFQYLIKEFLQVTGPQFETGHLIWICTIQMVKPLIVVFKCYVLLRKLKVVGQIQDVSADRVQFFFCLIGIGKRKRSFRNYKEYLPIHTPFDKSCRHWWLWIPGWRRLEWRHI